MTFLKVALHVFSFWTHTHSLAIHNYNFTIQKSTVIVNISRNYIVYLMLKMRFAGDVFRSLMIEEKS